MAFRSLGLLAVSLLPTLAVADDQGTSIIYPTTAAPGATALPSANGYSYVGCWNETTGIPQAQGSRALTGGKESANNTMTVSDCLAYCSKGNNGQTMQYAGIEYGRECYCAPSINTLSEKLNETKCDFACNGNATELCGGQLTLSLYNLTSDSKTGIAWSLVSAQPAWYGSAAIITLVIAAIL